MSLWKLSQYTSIVSCEAGDVLLYNSFMGAIARIPPYLSGSIASLIGCGATDTIELANPVLKELSDGGFLVPSDLLESEQVRALLDKERNSTFSIIILPHENCNFRCQYCYEKYERGKMTPDVVIGLKALVDRKAKEYQRISVSWFGGEPLLARDVICDLSDSFIQSCSRAGIPYNSSITTNGYLLAPDVTTALLHHEIRYFQVTLDGPQRVHDGNRKFSNGKGTYQRILDNLKAMRSSDDDFRVKIRVNFNGTSLPLIAKWLVDEIGPLFSDDHRFAMSFHAIGSWGGPNDAVVEVCDAGAASEIRTLLNTTSLTSGFSDQFVKEVLQPHGSVCYAAKESSVVVGADGSLYKCTVAFGDSRNHVGRLTRAGQMAIDEARWKLWVQPDPQLADRCAGCSFYPPCQGRKCPLSVMNNGQPACPVTKTELGGLVRAVAFGVSQSVKALREPRPERK